MHLGGRQLFDVGPLSLKFVSSQPVGESFVDRLFLHFFCFFSGGSDAMQSKVLGLVVGGIIAVAVLLLVLLRDPPGPPVQLADVVPTPVAKSGNPSQPVAPSPRPPPSEPVLQDLGTVAAPQTPAKEPSTEWKAPWAAIPLDVQGSSLGMQGQTAFRQTIVKAIKPELKNCIEMLPSDKDVPLFNVELFVEATGDGYLIKRAEVPRDAGLDPYESRCFEAAFEKRIALESSSNRSGALYHLGFPLRISPPVLVDPDAGVGG